MCPNSELSPNASSNFLRAEKINEFWKIMERRFYENLSPEKAIRVNLGVDLGTSYSKVVWRIGENAYPLCFGQNRQKLSDYLVPSTVAFGKNEITCGLDAKNGFAVDFSLANFKMCLACESEKNAACNLKSCSLTKWPSECFKPDLENDEAAFVNAFFLSRLLAQTKKLILAELIEKGFRQPVNVKWTANFSVPERFIELSEVSVSFQNVFKTAWLMAEFFLENPELQNRECIFDCYLTAKDLMRKLTCCLQKEGKDFDCFAYSEIGAEVASILLSRTSEEGLYAFVDIGAGTVDASVFRFWRDGGETKRPPYTAEVFKNGAAQVEMRAGQISGLPHDKLKEIKEDYETMSSDVRKNYAKEIESLKSASEQIKAETIQILKKVFKAAYLKEPNINRWHDLKLILGGGGSKLKCYREGAHRAFTLEDKKNPKPPETAVLPKPNDFQMFGLPEVEFHRFAVAYGLSHEIVNLPEMIFAKDVAPAIRPRRSAHIVKNRDWYEK
jgi:hypothetical protein